VKSNARGFWSFRGERKKEKKRMRGGEKRFKKANSTKYQAHGSARDGFYIGTGAYEGVF